MFKLLDCGGIFARSLPGELLERVKPRVGILDLGGLNEDRVELAGEERFRQLPEERLEQARHHVHVLPAGLLLKPEHIISALRFDVVSCSSIARPRRALYGKSCLSS